jgi:hypothetical protein
LSIHSQEARGFAQNRDSNQRRAEALFKKEEQQREGQKAMAEYLKERQAELDKTARLRALRLAHEAEGANGGRGQTATDRSEGARRHRPRSGLHAGARGTAR